MIASLSGIIEKIDKDSAVINVNGIGFLVHVPASIISNLGEKGHETRLLTQMIVREDSMALYGFNSEGELDLFQILTSVSGIGPKLALAMLSAMSVDQLCSAITTDNISLLTEIPGIGKKTANRIVLELKDKVSTELISSVDIRVVQDNAEVVSALTSLGYSIAEASKAVANLPPGDISLEEKIKLALQHFTD